MTTQCGWAGKALKLGDSSVQALRTNRYKGMKYLGMFKECSRMVEA